MGASFQTFYLCDEWAPCFWISCGTAKRIYLLMDSHWEILMKGFFFFFFIFAVFNHRASFLPKGWAGPAHGMAALWVGRARPFGFNQWSTLCLQRFREKLVSEGGGECECPPTKLPNAICAWQVIERLSLKKQAVAWYLLLHPKFQGIGESLQDVTRDCVLYTHSWDVPGANWCQP